MESGKIEEDKSVRIEVSLGNSQYYVPIVDDALKPFVGQLFLTVHDSHSFYLNYAKQCGFGVRKGTDRKSSYATKLTVWKYFLCNRQGYIDSWGVSSINAESSSFKRRRPSNRCGCPAKVTLRYVGRKGYLVKKFIERHNHPMVPESLKHLLRNNCKLTSVHQDFIINCLKSNIGTSKAYKLFKNSVGSYSDVGATLIDFKNFYRDLNTYMIGYDGQIAIDSLFRRKEACEAFYFDYHVNNKNQLCRLFWADPVCPKSFSFFGDVVSADATYKSNRYDMVFVPFTGVDNNKKSVTFGFGLLLNEDIDSYVWLFDNFKKAMGHEPHVVLTNQDQTVKVAVEMVFTTSVHRFCMWHIMFKVPVKVKVESSQTEAFRQRFNSIVWSNELKENEFEDAWHSIILDFNLEDNTWLQTMFDLRHYWIPAFFHGVSMGGLLRTTSRSESHNSFFASFIGASSSLVVFLMQFENAIDSQRYTQRKLDLESSTCLPSFRTHFEVEKQCASAFTLSVFYDLQVEIYDSVFNCVITGFIKECDIHSYHVRLSCGKVITVNHSTSSDDLLCSCNKFLNVGLPCSHMFTVLRTVGSDFLPKKYINARWSKKSSLKPTFIINDVVVKEAIG